MAFGKEFFTKVAFGAQGSWESAIGPVLLMLTTPYFVLALGLTALEYDGSFASFLDATFSSPSSILRFVILLWESPSIFAFRIIIAFFAWAVIMTTILPGTKTQGPATPNGHVPIYNDNGFLYYFVTLGAFFVASYISKFHYDVSPTIIIDRWPEIVASLNIFALFFCSFLLIKGWVAPSPGSHGSSGNILFDFYWGLELYPRVLGVDVKQITNCRFGMTSWPLLIILHGIKNWELNEGKFVDAIWISIALQLVYITKFFWWEGGYMRTLDIILDKAGYYLCWGCLVFVPGFYASPTLYLVRNGQELGSSLSLIILSVGLASIGVNYASDWQKDAVRSTNGDVVIWGQKAKVISAMFTVPGTNEKRESLLLISGFWGLARHFNYGAEIALAFCWCWPGLFRHLYPFCYAIFLTVLLVHRTFRDERKCAEKYGPFWEEYCRRVPSRIIPFIF